MFYPVPVSREADGAPDWRKQEFVASISGSHTGFSEASWWFEVRFS